MEQRRDRMAFNEGHKKEQMVAQEIRRTVKPLAPSHEGPFDEAKLRERMREYGRRLGSRNFGVRIEAMKELEKMGKGAAPALGMILDAMHDGNYRVRALAAESLGHIQGSEAEKALNEALDDELHQPDGKIVREAVKGALLSIQQANIPFPTPEL